MLRLTHFCILFFSFALLVSAQSRRGSDNSQPLIPDLKRPTAENEYEEELIRRAEIRREEDSHREMVERAREGAQLGSQLRASFEKSKALGGEEFKMLDRLEKLARKIRGSAGGSDDEEPLQNPPSEVGSALNLLAELSVDLEKRVEKTSRHVTSASVIKRSNEVIELIRYVRRFAKR